MRALLFLVGVLAVGCGAQPSEEGAPLSEEAAQSLEPIGEAEGGLTFTRISDAEVTGAFTTPVGNVSFSSVMVEDDVIDVKFDRGGRVLASHVDWVKLENDVSISGGRAEITADDRAILQALTTALEQKLDKTTKVTDNLVRQAILWGAHPEGRLLIEHITVSEARSWTTLCNGTSSRNFSHDTGSHALETEYLKYGPAETSNPCRARCGPGCSGVGTSAWTVDCGEHDRCEQLHSGGCNDEFTSASDDYSFAKNCAY